MWRHDITSIKAIIASLESRFLEFYEIDRQRQLVVQEISLELKEQLEAKAGELKKVSVERDARAKEKREAQQQLQAKAGKLQKVIADRDARAKEKREAQQQLGAQSSKLMMAHNALNEKRFRTART